MNRKKLVKKLSLATAVMLGGGTLLQGACSNTLLTLGASTCGTVFAFCTPGDAALMLFRFFEIPDFDTDPTCTIPFACGPDPDDNLFPPPIGGGGGGVTTGGGGGGGGVGGGGGGGI